MSSVSLTQANSPQIPVEMSELIPTNWTERFVVFLDSNETPFLYKIGAVALPLISAFAASDLVGLSLAASLIIVAITAIFSSMIYRMEKSILASREVMMSAADVAQRIALSAVRIQQDRGTPVPLTDATANHRLFMQAMALTIIQIRVGGTEAFNALPVLRVDQIDNPLDIRSLQPGNLSHSVMRGRDPAERYFISLKLRSNSPNAPQEPFVITFFQSDPQNHVWSYGTSADRVDDAQGNPLFNANLGNLDRQSIRSIIAGQHPVLSLV